MRCIRDKANTFDILTLSALTCATDAGVLPTKLASEDREIEVRCRVVYIDMEGLSDGRSIKNLISTVGPKQLVIVGGGSSSVSALGDHAREKRAYGKVTVSNRCQLLSIKQCYTARDSVHLRISLLVAVTLDERRTLRCR
jgi:Zn-dependent metallo-hydrolase RNA specificity domain